MTKAIYSIGFTDEADPELTWQNCPNGVIIGPYRHPLGLYEHTGVGTGIPLEPNTPLLVINNTDVLSDGEPARGGRWYISRRAKDLFERLDAGAFDFRRTQTRVLTTKGEYVEGPEYYMCDVIRFVDALDEDRSRVNVIVSGPIRVVIEIGDQNVFRSAQINGHEIFRLMYSASGILCTEDFRAAVQQAGLTGFRFVKTGTVQL